MQVRGPVFVTAFNPLCMVIVAALSTFLLAEKMYLGRVMGAVIIVLGLYFVIWGKSKEYNDEEEDEPMEMFDVRTETEMKLEEDDAEMDEDKENWTGRINNQGNVNRV